MNVDTNLLRNLMNEYIDTLEDGIKEDWYSTPKGFATGEVSRFIDWIESKTGDCDVCPSCGEKSLMHKWRLVKCQNPACGY